MKEHQNQQREHLRHLSIEVNPREHGLTPYRVTFTRAESPPLPSMLAEGIWYQHTERTETTVVWAREMEAIPKVLTYHYQDSFSDVRILPPEDRNP